jgi:arsenate reductase-like glutaredoxin family protein
LAEERAVNIQIFGFKNCQDTRKAERFFKERRVPFHFVDMAVKPMSPGELQRVAAAVPPSDLIDDEGQAYKSGGYEYRQIDILEELLEHQELIKTPVVRNGREATAGMAPEVWKRWIQEAQGT